jgi:protein O-GlcNAc transferase
MTDVSGQNPAHTATTTGNTGPAKTPPWADPRLETVVSAAQANQKTLALERAQALCARHADDARLLCGAAEIAAHLGAHQQALTWMERAYEQAPSATLQWALLTALLNAGESQRAEHSIREALRHNPESFELHNFLGVALRRQGRHEESLSAFQAAAIQAPTSATPWFNQGNAYLALKQPAHAAQCYQQAHQRDPENAEILRLLGRSHLELRQLDAALAAFNAASARNPNDPRIMIDLSHAHHLRPDPETALGIIDTGLARFTGHRDLLRQRGSILRTLGRYEEALAVFQALLKHNPDDIDALVRLGNLYLWGLNRRDLANHVYEQVLQRDPQHLEAARNYCDSLTNSRHGDESAHFQRAYELACSLVDQAAHPLELASSVQSALLRACDYERIARLGSPRTVIQHFADERKVHQLHNQLGRVDSMADRLALLEGHRIWGESMQRAAQQRPLAATPRKRPLRPEKIRIGLMSSDLCEHPVGYFAQPILEGYDRDRFELYCYSFRPTPPDTVQQHFARQVAQFRSLRGGSDREIATHIAQDELDILFELGGTTALNRINVCSWRPAPIQVSWLGYPHSAGLSCIDYLLVDPFIQPSDPSLMLERPFLMPRTWVALGSIGFSDAVPIEAGLPEERAGHITFGTANNPYKYTPAAFSAWAAILHAVSNARFVFIRPEANAASFRSNVCRHFAKHGIAPERIEFIGVRGQHKPFYNRIDIALDPFPHVGGTTTCESLWMGVPTVTLTGPSLFERLSTSNLHNAGLSDLCAHTPSEYVRIAATLAADRPRRQRLRHGLRDQIRAHPLGQSERFVRDFEAAIERTLATHSETGASATRAAVTP